MRYIVIEIQTSADGTVGNLVTAYDTLNEAESKFHSIMAAAAVSKLPCHAALIVRSDGTLINSGRYEHEDE